MRLSLDGQTVIAMGQLPDPVIVVVAAWIAVAGDAALADACAEDLTEAGAALDVIAFAALYLMAHEAYWGAPFALPAGACAIDGATGHAMVLMPRQLVELTPGGAWQTNAPGGQA